MRRWRSTWNLIEICKVCGNQIAGHLTWAALTWDLNWKIFLRFNSPPTSETGLSLSWSFLFIKRWHFMGHPNIIACRPNLISMRGRTLYLRGLLWISTSVGRLLCSYEIKCDEKERLILKLKWWSMVKNCVKYLLQSDYGLEKPENEFFIFTISSRT